MNVSCRGRAMDAEPDLAEWLRQHHASPGCERALRCAMTETVGDLLFLVKEEADLLGMGLSSTEVAVLWPPVRKLITEREAAGESQAVSVLPAEDTTNDEPEVSELGAARRVRSSQNGIEIEVMCPLGTGPGENFEVETEWGAQQVTVPDGAEAGDTFLCCIHIPLTAGALQDDAKDTAAMPQNIGESAAVRPEESFLDRGAIEQCDIHADASEAMPELESDPELQPEQRLVSAVDSPTEPESHLQATSGSELAAETEFAPQMTVVHERNVEEAEPPDPPCPIQDYYEGGARSHRLHDSRGGASTQARGTPRRRTKVLHAAMSPRERARQKPQPLRGVSTPKFGQSSRQSRSHLYRARSMMETVIATKTERFGSSHPETMKSQQSLVTVLEQLCGWDETSTHFHAREPAASLATLLEEMGRPREAKKVRKQLRVHDEVQRSEPRNGTETQASAVSTATPVHSKASAVAKWQKAAHAMGQAAVAVKRLEETAQEQKALTPKEVEMVTARLLSTQKPGADEAWRKEREVMHGIHFGLVEREVVPGRTIAPKKLTKSQVAKSNAERYERHRAALERHEERRETFAEEQATKVLSTKHGMSPGSRAMAKKAGKRSPLSERLHASSTSATFVREKQMLEQSRVEAAQLRLSMTPEISPRSRQLTQAAQEDDPDDAFERLYKSATKTMARQNELDAARRQQESMNCSSLHVSAADLPALF